MDFGRPAFRIFALIAVVALPALAALGLVLVRGDAWVAEVGVSVALLQRQTEAALSCAELVCRVAVTGLRGRRGASLSQVHNGLEVARNAPRSDRGHDRRP